MSDIKIRPPRVLWLQWHGDADPKDEIGAVNEGSVTWCRDRIYEHDLRYIRLNQIGEMSLQEAIGSGRSFRRKGWPDDGIWLTAKPGDECFLDATAPDDEPRAVEINIDDILANDWELSPSKGEIDK